MSPISIVIPTFNAAEVLVPTLASLAAFDAVGLVHEVIVVDGGSTDATREIAVEAGAVIVSADQGRGPQLIAGAGAARGDWLLFLHADTVLSSDWHMSVRDFFDNPPDRSRAAYFRFALDDDAAAARRLESIVNWRARRLGLPYGDQGLLIARAHYEAIGGYRPLALMEDVDIARRIGRHRLVGLAAAATTSAAKFRRTGYLRRSARNLLCLGLYFLGMPPRLIGKVYG
jgi:rSAM/selenodomain-associated transferase 2